MGYVDESLRFYNFKEFYERKELIKARYEELSKRDKSIYKLYVYSNRLLTERKADKIWEYLNEPFGSFYYVSGDMLGVYL